MKAFFFQHTGIPLLGGNCHECLPQPTNGATQVRNFSSKQVMGWCSYMANSVFWRSQYGAFPQSLLSIWKSLLGYHSQFFPFTSSFCTLQAQGLHGASRFPKCTDSPCIHHSAPTCIVQSLPFLVSTPLLNYPQQEPSGKCIHELKTTEGVLSPSWKVNQAVVPDPNVKWWKRDIWTESVLAQPLLPRYHIKPALPAVCTASEGLRFLQLNTDEQKCSVFFLELCVNISWKQKQNPFNVFYFPFRYSRKLL